MLLSHPSQSVPAAAPLQTARTANASWPVPRPPGQHPRVPGPVGLECPPPQRGYPEGWGYVCERKKKLITGETQIKKEKEADTSEAFSKCLPRRGGQKQPPLLSAQRRHSVTICRIKKTRTQPQPLGKLEKRAVKQFSKSRSGEAADKPGAPVTPTPSPDRDAHATHCRVLTLPGAVPPPPSPLPGGTGQEGG